MKKQPDANSLRNMRPSTRPRCTNPSLPAFPRPPLPSSISEQDLDVTLPGWQRWAIPSLR